MLDVFCSFDIIKFLKQKCGAQFENGI